MVFQISMLNRRRGPGSICHGYMCIVLYMKLTWGNGFPKIYGQLEGMGSICHWYMCIVLYMKLTWCNGFPKIYAHLKEGVGSFWHGYV